MIRSKLIKSSLYILTTCGLLLIGQSKTVQASSFSEPYARQQVIYTIQGWADAWASKDVKGYLGYYAADFLVPAKMTRGDWERVRASRITKPNYIEVDIRSIDVDFWDESIVQIRFTQTYRSDRYRSQSVKTMMLKRDRNRWLITREWVEKEHPLSRRFRDGILINWDTDGTAPSAMVERSYDSINSVIKTAWPSIQAHYKNQAKYNPELAGEIKVQLKVSKRGRLTQLDITSDSVGSLTLANYILDQANLWQFGNVEPGTYDITFPFNNVWRVSAR